MSGNSGRILVCSYGKYADVSYCCDFQGGQCRVNDTPCTATEYVPLAEYLEVVRERDEARKEREEMRESFAARFRDWRGVETPCSKCGGNGIRCYPNTATWAGGIGGQALTNDVCDACWGTGDEHRHGADLRKMRYRIKELERAAELGREKEGE